jgi:hypothetical protein
MGLVRIRMAHLLELLRRDTQDERLGLRDGGRERARAVRRIEHRLVEEGSGVDDLMAGGRRYEGERRVRVRVGEGEG